MARIVEPPKPKHVTCDKCHATIEYLPEEVDRYSGRDISGGADGYERVRCPRPKCPGYGYIRVW
jgi:hypothetical protein